jgi:ribonuclease Z
MEYTTLGSSASLPTRDRGLPAGLFIYDDEHALLDCGEGTVRQLVMLGRGPQRVSDIWLSHSHVDHYLGVAGLLQAVDLAAPESTITVYGSSETLDGVRALIRICALRSLRVDLRVVEAGVIRQTDRLLWRAFRVSHTVECFGLAIEEEPRRVFDNDRAEALGIPAGPLRGRLAAGETVQLAGGQVILPDQVLVPGLPSRKLVYVPDTEVFDQLAEHCARANLLICESTYGSNNKNLATKYKHMTALDAATLARRAAVGHLLLTHVSPREDGAQLEAEARSVFERATVA